MMMLVEIRQMELNDFQKRQLYYRHAKAHPWHGFQLLPAWARVFLIMLWMILALAVFWCFYVLLWAVFPGSF